MRVWFLLAALLVFVSFLPITSHAVRLVDRNYDLSRLVDENCIVDGDYDRLGIYPNKSSDKGFQANFHSEKDLLELLTKFYGCDILKSEGKEAYLISFNNRKEDGAIRTIMASVDLEREDAIRMPSKMDLYSSMEGIRAIDGYADMVKNYGKENVFFQGVNVDTFQYIGLFSADGNLLVDADGQLVQ